MMMCALTAGAQVVYDNPQIVFENDDEKHIFLNDKLEVVLSLEKGAPLMDFTENPMLEVYVKNNSGESILVDPQQITVTAKKGNKTKNLEVYTRKKLESKYNNKMFWFGPNNYKDVTETKKIEFKDEDGKKQTAQQQVTTKVYTGEADKAQEIANKFFNDLYLKKNTVFSENEIYGVVVTDKAKMETIEVTIDLGGDRYISTFDIRDWWK